MNEEQREVAERLIVRLDTAPAPLRDPDLNDEAAELLRELAAEPVQEATPDDMKVYDAIAANYAAPQQPMRCPTDGGECGAGGYCRPEPQQRKPLTDKQIEAILDEFDVDLEAWKPLARAIERAITGEPT